jgi:hypothetical protein
MPADLDQLNPEMGQEEPAMDTPADTGGDVIGTHGDSDREGAMAKADLFKLANYSHKLYQQINDNDQFEAWVQAKITKAADYIASVYHYLEYEMKFSEYGHHLDNSDTLSESQKRALKNRLMEAKMKVKELKKAQAEKIKEKKVDEGVMSGGEQPCEECGGTGVVHVPGIAPHPTALAKVEKYKRLVNATKAAHRRMDGQSSVETEVDEESEGNAFTAHKRPKTDTGSDFEDKPSSTGGKITRKGGVTRHKGNTDRFNDEPYDAASDRTKSHAKARSSADKAGEREMDKADEKESKAWGKANPGKQTIMKGGVKTTNEAKKADKDYDGDGKVESGKDEYLGSRIAAARKAGKLKEGLCSACHKDPCVCKKEKKCNECGMYESKCSCVHESADKTMSRAAKGMMKYGKEGMKALAKAGKEGKDLDKVRDKYDKYDESAKPSAGLSAAKKSATVKKAKAGGDIGKPGKGFDKLAKKAGGGEKGEKIAAAAMWKNIKETTAYMAEKKVATKDLPGKQEKLDVDKDGKLEKSDFAALRAGKKETVKESTDFGRLQELTGRLNRTEKPALVENREVDQIRALTKRLLG